MTAGGDKTPKSQSHTARTYFDHSSAQRVNTDAVIVDSLRSEYPLLHLTVVPQRSCNLIFYASSGNAGLASIDNEKDRLRWNAYIPPATRLDGSEGAVAETVKFGKFLLDWEGKEFIVLVVEGRDGTQAYPNSVNQYILSASTDATDRLLLAAGKWSNDLHGEIWVFDGGYWQKSAELWDSVSKASWDDVILDADMKESIRSDVDHFFSSRDTYANLKVPWKRGIIYWGPPGNGKTISIKATMHTLYERKDPIPTLYVRSLSSFAGPEYSINQIFSLARRTAPCYLVFEDLDTIVSDNVRSYFLNEVDGIERNDGILMLGSTNHLDRLDPGISKRPSRFDRKYLFPNPDEPQRVQYAHYWQKKLDSNEEIEFPDALCEGIASITGGFSFAYIQEAMVASLLAIAAGGDKGKTDLVDDVRKPKLEHGGDKDLEKLVLWREIKKQVKILRDEMGDEDEDEVEDGKATMCPAMSDENKAALKKEQDEIEDIRRQLRILTDHVQTVKQKFARIPGNSPALSRMQRAIEKIETDVKNSAGFMRIKEENPWTKVGRVTLDRKSHVPEENWGYAQAIKDGIKPMTDELHALEQEMAGLKISKEETGNKSGKVAAVVVAPERSEEEKATRKKQQDFIQSLKDQVKGLTRDMNAVRKSAIELPRGMGWREKQNDIQRIQTTINCLVEDIREKEMAMTL